MTEAPFTLVQFLREGIDPVGELTRIRTEQPVYRFQIPNGPTAWLVTRYEDVRTVLGDVTRFSNDFSNVTEASGGQTAADKDPGGLGFRDPPEHTRLRRMLTPEFTVHRLRRLEPRIDAIIADRLDAMEGAGSPVDFVREFAMPIPSLVVCELLGVPYAEQADFLERTNNRFEFSGGPETSLAAVGESLGYLTDLVARQRANPGDGLLGMLIREQCDDIDDRELAGMADGLLTGGHDTTASMLALGAIVLLNDPETRDALVHDDAKAGPVVEELLRLLSVVQVPFPRFAREEVELGGERIGKGDLVLCSLTSANRDPVLGEDMDRFDPGRGVVPHFAFGHGVHHCVGAQLARMEMRVAYPALFRRFPTLRLDVPMPEVQFRALSIVYGVQTLPVAW